MYIVKHSERAHINFGLDPKVPAIFQNVYNYCVCVCVAQPVLDHIYRYIIL